jgi:hypothetical protein
MRTVKQIMKAFNKSKIRRALKEKMGKQKYTRSMDRQLISEADTFLWLSREDVKGETESEIIVTQDQALQNQTETDSKCRLRKQFDETVEHIISACPI